MFTIDRDSQAGRALEAAFKREDLYKVSFAIRENLLDGQETRICVKVNEAIWSAPLPIGSDDLGNYDPTLSLPVTGLICSDCGLIVWSILDAKAHEDDPGDPDPDNSHGGWDTIVLMTNLEMERHRL